MGGELETGEEVAAQLAPAGELDSAPAGPGTAHGGRAAAAHALSSSAAPGAPPDDSEYLRRLAARPASARRSCAR